MTPGELRTRIAPASATADPATLSGRGMSPGHDATGRASAEGRAGGAVVALFTGAVLAAAALLFVVQPMVGKMVLPLGGGSPQVWNTSLVFFQAALLAGYMYAHYSIRWLGVRRQAVLHVGVLALPLLVLPIALPDLPPPDGGGQSIWILSLLALAVGAPFFVLASMSPLLQRWFAATRHEAAGDPYFLYAASNAGSLLGLLAYPFVLEPLLPLSAQSGLWAAGYGLFALLATGCIVVAARASDGAEGARSGGAADEYLGVPAGPHAGAAATVADSPGRTQGTNADATGERDVRRPSAADRRFWVLSAAIPSALLLGVTHFLTSHIASVPLLWVLPLAVYLGTFIVAFARRRMVSAAAVSRALAILVVVLVLTLLARMMEPAWALVLLHLGVLGAAGLLCHLRLVERRPSARHLTEFYLLVSFGGVLGGASCALAAPYLFDYVAEYPIALALAALLRVVDSGRAREARAARVRGIRVTELVLPAALAVYVLLAHVLVGPDSSAPDWLVVVALAAVPTLAIFLFSNRPLAFALGLAIVMTFAQAGHMYRGELLHAERTFFGVYRVSVNPGSDINLLYHGSTVHGVQSRAEDGATEPLAYYHRSGPAGRVVSAMAARPDKRELALVGGGTGALAALAAAHQHVTLYEIDEAVVRIAEDPRFFTFLSKTPASYETVVADGRLALSRTTRRFDGIVLDAFTSGAIPLHLLTREAMQLYLDRLAPGGVLLFHISNRHLDLAPVLAAHARDLGLVAFENVDVRIEEERPGIFSSHWVIVARSPADLAYIPSDGWRPLAAGPGAPSWTDDFSNLLSVQRWN